jgi:hypothetical protein
MQTMPFGHSVHASTNENGASLWQTKPPPFCVSQVQPPSASSPQMPSPAQQASNEMHVPSHSLKPLTHVHAPLAQAAFGPQSALAQQLPTGMQEPLHGFDPDRQRHAPSSQVPSSPQSEQQSATGIHDFPHFFLPDLHFFFFRFFFFLASVLVRATAPKSPPRVSPKALRRGECMASERTTPSKRSASIMCSSVSGHVPVSIMDVLNSVVK